MGGVLWWPDAVSETLERGGPARRKRRAGRPRSWRVSDGALACRSFLLLLLLLQRPGRRAVRAEQVHAVADRIGQGGFSGRLLFLDGVAHVVPLVEDLRVHRPEGHDAPLPDR